MVVRKIIQIDEDKCDGCGLCIPSCAEGALQIVDGKAKLITDKYCDGLGACLGECPQDAIAIVERDADEFDEDAVEEHLEDQKEKDAHHFGGCPGAQVLDLRKESKGASPDVRLNAELTQWPIQLNLVPPNAPYFDNSNLLIAADCVPFAYPNFHQDFLRGKAVVIGCPKLDDAKFYKQKLAQIIKQNNIKSITLVNMEVPCCFGLQHVAEEALKLSGKKITIEQKIVSIGGQVLGDNGR